MGLPRNSGPAGFAGKLQGLKPKKPSKAPAKGPARTLTAGRGEEKARPRSVLTAAELSKYLPQRSAGSAMARIDRNMRPEDYGLDYEATSDMYKIDPTLLGRSRGESVQSDPAAIAAQQRAMDELFGIYSQGGATAQDRAREAQARANSDQYLRSQREAHQQDLAERGMGGSGAEIGMLLGDRQNAGQQMSQSDLETQAMHEQRAMDALMRGGDLAGKMRSSSFEEAGYRAESGDAIDLWNNKVINGAAESNTEFLRKRKEARDQEAFEANENKLNRNTRIAGGLVGSDAAENTAGFGLGKVIAETDVDSFNRAGRDVADTVAGLPGAGEVSGISSGKTAEAYGANKEGLDQFSEVAEGAGQAGDGVFGAFSGDKSGRALNGFGKTPADEDEED